MSSSALVKGAPFEYERYELLKQIAAGGMAEVFLARQRSESGFDKHIAIKRLRKDKSKDSRILSMFADEAMIGAKLSHPNISQVFDVGESEGLPFIAMEHIEGEELSTLCRRGIEGNDFLPLCHTLELIRQAALALGYVHDLHDEAGASLDVVHCDISPTNFLITQNGFLKLIDFGISRFRGQDYVDEDVVPGKLSYMSPEQARRETLDKRSDLYSLGIVLYELSLGARLFRGSAADIYDRVASGDVTPPTFINHDFAVGLETIIMKLLDRNPSERYQDAHSFVDDLQAFARASDLESSTLEVARYLSRLNRQTTSSSAEEYRIKPTSTVDEALDFDQRELGRVTALSADSTDEPSGWDEVEEDEKQLADILGIDPALVSSEAKAISEEALRPYRSSTGAPKEQSQELTSPTTQSPSQLESTKLRSALFFLLGVVFSALAGLMFL